MCKERSKSARKYLQTGCTIYRPDLSFDRMLLIVYFVTSKFGLLNVNGFSLINFISLKRKSQIVEYKSHVTEYKLQIDECVNFLLNVSHLLNIKSIC